jgi:hypothetical protein
MASCAYKPTCFVYNECLEDLPCTGAQIRQRYCDGEYERCARYIYSTTRNTERVPKYLFPDDAFLLEKW